MNHMSSYSDYVNIAKIDDNHAEFVKALVACKKPRAILELGFGGGMSCRAIRSAIQYNGYEAEHTLVDNWLDFGGARPHASFAEEFRSVEFVTSGEYEFFQQNKNTYDFIFSDADHLNTEKWFEHVYKNVLRSDGVLIYHDITNVQMFPNLLNIYSSTLKSNFHHVLLNRNSRPDERCDRGLLAIFKN